MDQDIFSFVNPDDLRHIYKDDAQVTANYFDTSWQSPNTAQSFQAGSQSPVSQQPSPTISNESQQLPALFVAEQAPISVQYNNKTPSDRLRSNSSPAFSRPHQFPFYPTISPIGSPKRRVSNPEKSFSYSKYSKYSDCDDSSYEDEEEDNGMEFFEAEKHPGIDGNTDESSYDMDVIPPYRSTEKQSSSFPKETYGKNKKRKSFKLQSSKSPVIDALVYCALTNQGLTLMEAGNTIVRFRMHDFPLYYKKSQGICSKAHPTDDLNSRVKALQRWFPDFPTLKELGRGMPSIFSLSREKNDVNFGKMQVILERQKQLVLANSQAAEKDAMAIESNENSRSRNR
jgi:hypothetical protein